MENKFFLLEPGENSKIVKIFQIALGVTCIAIALFWIIYKIRLSESDTTLWVTIIFLIGFGLYEILAGSCKTIKFIEIGPEIILLKQNSVLPGFDLKSSDIEKIELYPLNITFYFKNNKKIILRFGINYTEIIEPVREAVTEFAKLNNIAWEVKKDEL